MNKFIREIKITEPKKKILIEGKHGLASKEVQVKMISNFFRQQRFSNRNP